MQVLAIPPNCYRPNDETHNYTQCRLRKLVDGGYLEQVAWIPTEFAVVGKSLKIREPLSDRTSKMGDWVDGWVVMGRGATKPGRDHNPNIIDGEGW